MSDPKLEVIDAPARVSVVICDLVDCQHELDEARAAIAELEISHPMTRASNVLASYVSPWHSHKLNPRLLPLCERVIATAKYAAKAALKSDFDNAPLAVANCWGIIYEPGNYTKTHNHFPATFGCVVFLDADEPCTPIVFGETVPVSPKPGRLVLFPGILDHGVPVHEGGRRVVISMNLRLEWGKPE